MVNTDGCVDQYICASKLYLMSVTFQYYSVIIDSGSIAPGYGKDMLYGLNDTDKCYIYQPMSNVKLPGSKVFDSYIIMNSWTKQQLCKSG